MIAGVCGGIAEYFFVDPVLVRGGFVLLGLLNGIGIILYIALAILMPEDGEESGTVSGADAIGPAHSSSAGTGAAATPPPTEEMMTLKRQRQLVLLMIVLVAIVALAPLFFFFSLLAWIF